MPRPAGKQLRQIQREGHRNQHQRAVHDEIGNRLVGDQKLRQGRVGEHVYLAQKHEYAKIDARKGGF